MNTDYQRHVEEVDRLLGERAQLEERAGISADLNRARQDPSAAREGSERLRQAMRDAYFSVRDEELRKELIAVVLRIEDPHIEMLRAEVAAAEHELSKSSSSKLPWIVSILFTVGGGVYGFHALGWEGLLPGAGLGLVVGVALGLRWTWDDARRSGGHAESLRREREHLQASLRAQPFGEEEQRTGRRDWTLDRATVFAARTAATASSAEKARSGPRHPASAVVTLAAVAVIGVGTVGGLLAYALWDEAGGILLGDAAFEIRPTTTLKGVRLGESFAEASVRHGPFDADPPVHPGSELSAAETHVQRDGPIRISVEKGRVKRVSYECKSFDWTRLNRIACHDPEERIRTVFGKAPRVLCARVANDDPRRELAPFVRAYDVFETGTRYVVIRNSVTGIIVMDPRELESAVGGESVWHPCR